MTFLAIVQIGLVLLTIYMNFLLQLRNLVWATSKHDVYLLSHFSVMHWSSLSCTKSEVLNVSGHVAPCEVSDFAFASSQFLLIWMSVSVCLCVFSKFLELSQIPIYFIFLTQCRSTLGACWKDLARLRSAL